MSILLRQKKLKTMTRLLSYARRQQLLVILVHNIILPIIMKKAEVVRLMLRKHLNGMKKLLLAVMDQLLLLWGTIMKKAMV